MKRVVLVSGHYLGSKRKAGFHWLAESFRTAGWDVLFFTAPISWLSRLRRDHRFGYPVREEANRICEMQERLRSFVWYTPWHPANLRMSLLNQLSSNMVDRYSELPLGESEHDFCAADLIVLESTPALVLFDRIRSLNPDARIVYRVSDDLRRLKNHPRVINTESRIASKLDLISVPCRFLLKRFSDHEHAKLHPHGVRKDLFDQPSSSPYDSRWERNVVFVGNDYFDCDFLQQARERFADWSFHIIGPCPGVVGSSNVFTYGELPFAETVPYLKHADIGLHTLNYSPGAESLTDSLKVMQYTYCSLPIIAPDFMSCERSNFFYYRHGDEASIISAMEAAAAFDRSGVDRSSILSWDDLRCELAGELTDHVACPSPQRDRYNVAS